MTETNLSVDQKSSSSPSHLNLLRSPITK